MPKSTVRDITVISDKPNQLNRPVLGDQYPQRNPRISK